MDPGEWTGQVGNVPFVFGLAAARKEVVFSGRPVLYFTTRKDCQGSLVLGSTAFRDPEVVRLARRFVPVLLDATRERTPDYGCVVASDREDPVPGILLTRPDAYPVGHVEGEITAVRLLAAMRLALERCRDLRITKAAREEEDAAEALEKARRDGNWHGVLRAVQRLMDVGHDGPALEAARKARNEAVEEAKRRIASVPALVAGGKVGEAKRVLGRVVTEFEGLPQAAEAKDLLRLLEAPPPDGGARGGGKGGMK